MSFRVRKNYTERGFSLAEALAALLLVGIVVPVALRCITVSLQAGSKSARRTEAVLLAESKLSELVATGAWEDTELAGDFQTTPSGCLLSDVGAQTGVLSYRWTAGVQDWLDPTVKELTVTVYWESRGTVEEVSLTTLVHTGEVTQ